MQNIYRLWREAVGHIKWNAVAHAPLGMCLSDLGVLGHPFDPSQHPSYDSCVEIIEYELDDLRAAGIFTGGQWFYPSREDVLVEGMLKPAAADGADRYAQCIKDLVKAAIGRMATIEEMKETISQHKEVFHGRVDHSKELWRAFKDGLATDQGVTQISDCAAR